jgi:hypothetical protein
MIQKVKNAVIVDMIIVIAIVHVGKSQIIMRSLQVTKPFIVCQRKIKKKSKLLLQAKVILIKIISKQKANQGCLKVSQQKITIKIII